MFFKIQEIKIRKGITIEDVRVILFNSKTRDSILLFLFTYNKVVKCEVLMRILRKTFFHLRVNGINRIDFYFFDLFYILIKLYRDVSIIE